MSVSRKSVLAVTAGGLGLALLATWFLNRPPSLMSVATRFRDCALAGDGACVRSLLTSAERQDNPASDAEITAMLGKFVRPTLAGSPGSFDAFGQDSQGWKIFSCPLQTSEGQTTFSVTVAETSDGIRVIDGLSGLLTMAAMQRDGQPKPGRSKFERLVEILPAWVPQLKELHIYGTRRRPSGQFVSWNEYVDLCRMAANGPPPSRKAGLAE